MFIDTLIFLLRFASGMFQLYASLGVELVRQVVVIDRDKCGRFLFRESFQVSRSLQSG